MSAHPLDRQVGLAGIGGPKNGPHKAVTRGGHDPDLGMDTAKRKRLCGQLRLLMFIGT
jgi:hypothetical protein